ncbi:MAG: hypothetical protein R3Y56_05970 [Akkermansia sp.]
MHNLAQPSILALASFTPALALLNTDLSTIAQQISAVGIMAYFLWRETKHNKELKDEIKELHKNIIELLKEREDK